MNAGPTGPLQEAAEDRIRETMRLGVVLERRPGVTRWVAETWQPLAVIPGAGELDPLGPWLPLREEGERALFHAGTLLLSLYRRETEGYRLNLTQAEPRVYVVLRRDPEDCPHPVLPILVTLEPYEAEKYLVSGEEIVEGVPLPEEVRAFAEDFVARHHVEEVFYKRQRKPWNPRKEPGRGGGGGDDGGPG